MMYNENLHEEEQHLIQQIAEQTERGKIDWELTEYNPLSFLNKDKIDKNPAVICQSFSFEAIIGGSRYELDVMENIDVPSGMGDYTITLTRDETENYLKIEDALSFDCDRYECTPEEVAERFADSPIVHLCNAIIPATLGQEDLEEVFTWARFFNEIGISTKLIVKAKLFCPEIAGLFCRIAGLFCHDSRANLSLKPVCFGIAIS